MYTNATRWRKKNRPAIPFAAPGGAPQPKGRSRLRLFSFITGLAALILIVNAPFYTVLAIRDTASNKLVWEKRVTEESAFAIRWIHSIHRTPVTEYYRVRDHRLVLVEMSFEDYGIGMNNELEPGEKLITRDGTFIVTNMSRQFPALHMFIGQVRANHTLLFQGTEIPFNTLDNPGSSVTIQVEKRSILDQIGG
jgi:hypothetical protein